MQYLPVVFAIFQVFFLAGLIIYYMAQAVLRIGQQAYITRRFYGHDEALGRQAQRAGESARELAKADKDGGGDGDGGKKGGVLRPGARAGGDDAQASTATKGRGAPSGAGDAAPSSNGDDEAHDRAEGPPDADAASRAATAPPSNRPGGARTKSSGKRRR